MTALETRDFGCLIHSDAQDVYEWFGGLGAHLNEAAAADAAEMDLIRRMWPLHAGNDAKWRRGDEPARWDFIAYSVDYGLCRVPAGIFWAFKIRKEYVRQGVHYTTTLWWSPSLRWTIRQWPESPGRVAIVGGFNWELLGFSIPGS